MNIYSISEGHGTTPNTGTLEDLLHLLVEQADATARDLLAITRLKPGGWRDIENADGVVVRVERLEE